MDHKEILNNMNTMEDKISIIIPTHNVEKYIERCINSVIMQTYKNLEIIVVDDFSDDNTYSILSKISENDERIKLLKNTSYGVSSARNCAIENSTGKYMMFLDGDDEYFPNMVENMYSYIYNHKAQMCVCNYVNIYSDCEVKNSKYCKDGNINKHEYLKNDAKDGHVIYYGVIWNKIYDGDIIRSKSIRFDESVTLGEDSIFNIEYYKYIKEIYVTEELLYKYYRNNQNSLTRKLNPLDTWSTTVKLYDKYIKLYEDEKVIDSCKEDISYIILSNVIFPIEVILKDNNLDNHNAVEKIKGIINNEVVEFALKNARKLSFTDKIINYGNQKNKYMLVYKILKIKFKVKNIKKIQKG